MKKNLFLSMLAFFAAAMLGVGLVSCSSDSDTESGMAIDEENLLVGNWLYENYASSYEEENSFDDTFILSFNNDGTFRLERKEVHGDFTTSTLTLEGTYIKDDLTVKCIISKTSNPSKVAVGTALSYNIEDLRKNKLILEDEDGKFYYTCTRTSYATLTAMLPSSIVGTWVYESYYYKGERKVTERTILTFKADGTAVYQYGNNENPAAKEVEYAEPEQIHYVYDAKNMKLLIQWTGWDDYQEDDILNITPTHMSMRGAYNDLVILEKQ